MPPWAAITAFATLVAAADAPKLRLGEVQSVAPTRYRVELNLDPVKPEFTGTIAIGLNVQKPLETLWLNDSGVTIAEARLTAGGGEQTAKVLAAGRILWGLHSID